MRLSAPPSTLRLLFAMPLLGLCSTVSASDPQHARLERLALTESGDAARGKELFRSAKLNCIACHRVGEEGGEIGPDLSSIGGKFDRPHLVESLLLPSQQIVEGYRTSTVLTTDGTILSGIVKEQSDDSITLYDAEAKPHKLGRSEIERIAEQNTSVMPTGLEDSMSSDDFVSLIAYLESLRRGGKHGAGSDIRGPVGLPPGFTAQTVVTGLSGATAMEVLPDGRILVCEQAGHVRVIEDGQLLPQPMVSLPVDSSWERGVIGVTVAPEFESNHFLFICWVAREPFPHHRVSRFHVEGNVADRESEKVLLVGDDQSKLGGAVPSGHQGGALHVGPDGKLYVAIGEQTAATPSQELDTFLGKMLRINTDGAIPEDNPLLDETTGKYGAIWAYGLRNPFTFAIRRDGLMLINDVGGTQEEINVGRAGGNYGWPIIQHGPSDRGGFIDPVHWYPEASIAGGDFLPAESDWPEAYHGRYFFADFKHGWIHTLDPEQPRQAQDFAFGLRRPVDLRFAPDGTLFVLLRNAWVIDGKFQGGTSSLLAIRPPSRTE